MKKNNRYVVFRDSFDVATELYYAQTLTDARKLKARFEGIDRSQDWKIATTEIHRYAAWLRRLLAKLDKRLERLE